MPNTPPIRIISGLYKGTKLDSPSSGLTHPMGSREKLALFNMISVRGLDVLDIFAGSGALGLEALSRGAKSVVFVEKSPQIAAVLRQNLVKCAPKSPNLPIYVESAAKFSRNALFHEFFDLILADPPYDKFDVTQFEALPDLLKPGGTLVLSSPASQDQPEFPELTTETSRTYAAARLTIFRKTPKN